MPPGECLQTCEIVVVGGATHSCLLALTGTPARHRGGEGRGREREGSGEEGIGRSQGREGQRKGKWRHTL